MELRALREFLSDRDLEILSLYLYDSYSLFEIGEMYGIRKQSVKNRLDKCLRYLAREGYPTPKRFEEPKRPMKRISMEAHIIEYLVAKNWTAPDDIED